MVKLSIGRKAKGAAIRRHRRYVSDVSQAPCAMSSGTKCGRIGCEARTKGVVTDHPRSLSSRSGQALCWPRIAEIPLQGLTSAVALVLCIHTGVSELLAHDEWGGLLSC